ncbi:hypothetical protein B296_00031709 [Ensete ventricosum]|uniref:Uncharacterized protein n=1 Tax=Ensete ventricosum TaxID=4639 RepID=A0A426ZZT7_ENSVE|nr:hypothetical protein B296_00031709 [Ensete ventricosum]
MLDKLFVEFKFARLAGDEFWLINADECFCFIGDLTFVYCIRNLTFVYCITEKNHGELSSWLKLFTNDYYYSSARFSRREIASPKTVAQIRKWIRFLLISKVSVSFLC